MKVTSPKVGGGGGGGGPSRRAQVRMLLLLVMALLPVALSSNLENCSRWTVPDVDPAAYIEVTGPPNGTLFLVLL